MRFRIQSPLASLQSCGNDLGLWRNIYCLAPGNLSRAISHCCFHPSGVAWLAADVLENVLVKASVVYLLLPTQCGHAA